MPRSKRSNANDDPDDIGGSMNVARGQSDKQAREKRKKLKRDRLSGMSPRERERMEAYLHGSTNADSGKRRLKALREDDERMQMDGLTPVARQNLERRRRRNKPDKIMKARMEIQETKRMEAALANADAEAILNTEQSGLLETEHEMERTYKLSQQELKRDHLDEQMARQIFDLKLGQYAPYGMSYDRSGRYGLLRGHGGGHVAVMDCHTLALRTEFHVNEIVRDGTFLHNPTMLALAQKKNVFIYDDAGSEIHRMTDHTDIFRMQFLPYHWLLATVGRAGYLRYHDTSTGEPVSTHRTRLGPCSVMRQNPSNAVIHLGHTNGTVTLWSPANSDYLVKILCHRGSPISCLSVDRSGRYMVTGGADSQVRIWDLRMYKETHSYFTRGGPPTDLDISQRGILGIGHGCHTTFWSPEALKVKVTSPYMGHALPGCGPVETLRFRPFEDVCGIGHQKGFSSIVIPGSGEPNLDTMEYNTNPFQDSKQRREAEVRSLLDKLKPEMIALDPDTVGTVEESNKHARLERVRDMAEEANARKEAEGQVKKKEKKKMRGRSKIQKKLNRKQKNIVDEGVIKLRELRDKEKAEKQRAQARGTDGGSDGEGLSSVKESAPKALRRFF